MPEYRRPSRTLEQQVAARCWQDPRAGKEPIPRWLTAEFMQQHLDALTTSRVPSTPYRLSKAAMCRIQHRVVDRINQGRARTE